MTTTVVVTGTGTPMLRPDRAGAGVLVQHAAPDGATTSLQFDAGRNTAGRLAEIGVLPQDLDAIFITHYHSDHLMGLQDIVLTHWTLDLLDTAERFDLVAPNGHAVRYCERMLDPWDADLAVRSAHNHREPIPKYDLRGFECGLMPAEVWQRGQVRVLAGPVRHEPVENAVGYRIETPDGVVVISGDTRVCDEMLLLAEGADVLVHEAMRPGFLEDRPPNRRYIRNYHADCTELGKQASRIGVPQLLLTHLIPPPTNQAEKDAFAADVRAGGYQGDVIVCDDLDSVVLG